VVDHWTDLERIPDLKALKETASAIGHLPMGTWLTDQRYELDDLWNEFVRQRDGDGSFASSEPDNLLSPEWSALTVPGGTDHGEDFAVSDPGVPSTKNFGDHLGEVYLASRLREVVAITSFTRLDAFDPMDTSDRAVRRARLTKGVPTWAPAAQSRGEGFLLTLNEDAVQAWETRLRSLETGRHQAMTEAQHRWRSRRGLDPEVGLVPNRFVLLHTLSHLLINAVSLHSGYSTASVRERIYCREPGSGEFPMAGILLYTAAADSEGTLGGLVGLGRPEVLGPLLDEAIEKARVCSSDPFCAAHAPSETTDASNEQVDDGSLHGAACHVCLFVPETSCDYANRYLDRGYCVVTLMDDEIAYFK
jgi:hypothetical protein